jgi:hypothetical protein
MFGVGVRKYIFLNILFDILEVSSHSCLEESLGITNVDLAQSVTFYFVDNNWDPADSTVFWQDFVGGLQLQSTVLKSSDSTILIILAES